MGEKRLVVAVAGASGYVGNILLKKLKEKAEVIGLSWNGNQRENTEDFEWRSCDLFPIKDAEKSLAGADIAQAAKNQESNKLSIWVESSQMACNHSFITTAK